MTMSHRVIPTRTFGEMGVLLVLLTSLALAFLLPPFLYYGDLVLRILVATALATSAYLVRSNRLSLGIMAIAGIAMAMSFTLPETQQLRSILYFLGSAVFLICVNLIFTIRIFRSQIVDTALLLIAMSVYLGFAAFAAMLFGLLETVAPGSFHVPSDTKHFPIEGTFMYFSIVTISTLGYGDVFPLTTQARTMASFEAVAGQIYLTFVVARLVGLHVSNSSTRTEH